MITIIFTGICFLAAGSDPAKLTGPLRVLIPNFTSHGVSGVPPHFAYIMFEMDDYDHKISTESPRLTFTDSATNTQYGVVFLSGQKISVDNGSADFPITSNPNPPVSDTTGTVKAPNNCCANGQRSNDVSFDERFGVGLLPFAAKGGACPDCGVLDPAAFTLPAKDVSGVFTVDFGHIAASFFTENPKQRETKWQFIDTAGAQVQEQQLAAGLAVDLVNVNDNRMCLVLDDGSKTPPTLCFKRRDTKRINVLVGNTPLDDMLLLNRDVEKDHIDTHFNLFYEKKGVFLKDVDKSPIPHNKATFKHGTGTNCPPLFVQ